MKISVEAIKSLRDKTGAPMGDVRSALAAANGDERKAHEVLKQKGFEASQKRRERTASQGRVESYVHHDGRVGVLVEVNCETDFVARLPQFQQFCKDLSMQIASVPPLCVSQEQLTEPQREMARQSGQSMEAFAKEACLLEQPFIKDSSQTIGQSLASLISSTGENIVIRRFVRFALGEASHTLQP